MPRQTDLKVGVKVKVKDYGTMSGKTGKIINPLYELNLEKVLIKRGHYKFPIDWKKEKLIEFDEGFLDSVPKGCLEIINEH